MNENICSYPKIRSIQLCIFIDTYSDSSARLCMEMKSSGDLAHGGRMTSSTRSFVFCNGPKSNLDISNEMVSRVHAESGC